MCDFDAFIRYPNFPSSFSNKFQHFFKFSNDSAPFRHSANATCRDGGYGGCSVLSLYNLLNRASSGMIPKAYIATAVGSPCVVPSNGFITFPR